MALPSTNRRPTISGRFGLFFNSTPASVLEQFAHYAVGYLLYDFVILKGCHLHTSELQFGGHSRELMVETFSKYIEHGVVVDPSDLVQVPREVANLDEFRKIFGQLATDVDLIAFRQQSEHARQGVEAREALFASRDASRKLGKTPDGDDKLLELVRAANSAIDDFERDAYKLYLTAQGYDLDDGAELQAMWNGQANNDIRPVLERGDLPLMSFGDDTSEAVQPKDKIRTFQLFIRNVPFPTELPLDEFLDFRRSRIVRNSIGQFRKLAADLISPQAPPRHVANELVSQYEEYREEVRRLRTKTVTSTVKFIVSSAAGIVEDVIKGRVFSGMVKRPFEIGTYFIDRSYEDRAYQKSPFFFILTKDPIADGKRPLPAVPDLAPKR